MNAAMRTLPVVLGLALAACGGSPGPKAAGPGGGAAAVTIATVEGTVPAGEELGDAHVRAPFVTVAGNPAASAAINAALGVPNTEAALAAVTELGEVGIDYQVGFNRDGLLDLTIIHETMGAYPDSYASHFLFDVATGKALKGADLLRADQLPALAAALDQRLQAELTEARQGNPDCVSEDDDPYQGQFGVDRLDDIGLNDGGLVFTYDYDFPHVIQACEPGGVFGMTFAEAAPYVRADGPLAALTR